MSENKKDGILGFEFNAKPLTMRGAPLVLTKPKTDRIVSRFQALLPDLDALTEKIISSDLDHTQAIEVQSRADDLVDWAPNVIVWCSDKRFIGMKPFAKQAEILLLLFEEFCPKCSDVKYVTNIPTMDTIETIMSKVALLEFGGCPHCGYTKGQGRLDGHFVDPIELIAVVGQRSGKSALASLAISYLVHRNLHLRSPWQAYGLTPGQVIDFTIVATTAGQADKTLWSTFKGIFAESHWFRQYKAVCDEEGKKHGVKETIKVSETSISFEHKSMLIYFAANNPAGLRGTTRFGAAIDELGWFGDAGESGTKKVRSNGPETHSALSNACLTLRGAFDDVRALNANTNIPVPLMFNISSPRAMNDPIMTAYRELAGDKRVIRRHYATYEFTPKFPKERLTRELSTPNGVRDFAAQPPITDDPLFQRIHVVTDCFKSPLATDSRYATALKPTTTGFVDDLEVPSGRQTISYITAGINDTIGMFDYDAMKQIITSDPEAWEALGPLQSVFLDIAMKPPSRRPHIMGVDLGTKNNALAVVCGYLTTDKSKFITDFALEVKPSQSRSVNLADVFDKLIIALVEKLNVVAVFYDTWQSIHQIQTLSQRFGSLGPLNSPSERRKWLKDLRDRNEKPKFLADHYSLNVPDANMLVARMEQGDCLFPAMEVGITELLVNKSLDPVAYPYDQLALQLATVRVRGARLLKPIGGDDDMFRAWANAAVKAFTDDSVIDLLSQNLGSKSTNTRPVGHSRESYVALSQTGKGLRRSGNLSSGALSGSNTTIGNMPLVVRRGNKGK